MIITAEEFEAVSSSLCRAARLFADLECSDTWLSSIAIYGATSIECFETLPMTEVTGMSPWKNAKDRKVIMGSAHLVLGVYVHVLWQEIASDLPRIPLGPGRFAEADKWFATHRTVMVDRAVKLFLEVDYTEVLLLTARCDVERAKMIEFLCTREAKQKKATDTSGNLEGEATVSRGTILRDEQFLAEFERDFGPFADKKDGDVSAFAERHGMKRTTMSKALKRADDARESPDWKA